MERLDRSAGGDGVALQFTERFRRILIERIDNVVGGGAGIEKPHCEGLPIERIPAEVKGVPEFALYAPEAVRGTVWHLPLLHGMLPIEVAVQKVRKLDLRGIGRL